MLPLIHLTMTTGHVLEQPREVVEEPAIKLLRPIVRAKGGAIPFFAPWSVNISQETGFAFFDIKRGKDMVVAGLVCWKQDRAEEAWGNIERLYLTISDKMRGMISESTSAMPEIPKRTPWLAVIILPSLATTAKSDVDWLGDFERCLAWAIIEEAEGP